MTAMREARGDSASADPINGVRKGTVNDRKFAFLNEITRPDYRSLPNSAATSQSSVPSTPITIPLRTSTDQSMFREFGAPIATPEDELLDEMEIKSEPLLSPRRMFTDFDDERRCRSEEKENREEEDTEADTTIREDVGDVEDVDADQEEEEEEKELMMAVEDEEEEEEEKEEKELEENEPEAVAIELQTPFQKAEEEDKGEEEFLRLSASDPPILDEKHVRLSPEEEKEAEEIRKMTESFGEPRKAVLERVYDTVGETDDDETETETETENEDVEEEEEEMDDDVQRQINAVSRPDDYSSSTTMVFGWNGKPKEKVEKPTTLPLRCEVEPECSTPRRAEFCIEPDDVVVDTSFSSSEDTTQTCGDEGVLQQSLIQLQKQLRKTDVRCSRLEKICEFQQRDIDSLRFEVDWKDKRIEYLQKTLQDMEAATQSSEPNSRSTSTS